MQTKLYKGKKLTVALIVIYVLIMFKFGLPYPNRHIIQGITYGGAAKESQFLRNMYVARRPFLISGQFAIAFGLGISVLEDTLLTLILALKDLKKAKRTIMWSFAAWSIALASEFIVVVLSIIITTRAQGDALKEYSRIGFLWAFAAVLGAFYFVYCDTLRIKYLWQFGDES